MQKIKKYILFYFKGMAMGSADIVPGVSGGSIALITGIYQRLLDAITSVNLDSLKLLFRGEFKAFYKSVDGSFLLSLLLGIATSLVVFSELITYLMKEEPIGLWSFFTGLILISAFIILKGIKRWHLGVLVSILVGAVTAYFVTELPPMSSPDSLWFTFVAGAIAICAMILPGISGSFLLLILGKYQAILTALTERDFFTLAVFASGCLVGILSFSRLISWLLKRFYSTTIGLLSGFMLGSINKLWPWKLVTSYRMSSSGEEKPFLTKNIMPSEYAEQLGLEPELGLAIGCFLFGIFLVFSIDRVADYFAKQ